MLSRWMVDLYSRGGLKILSSLRFFYVEGSCCVFVRLFFWMQIFESGVQIPLQPADQWIIFSENDLVPVKTDSEHFTW